MGLGETYRVKMIDGDAELTVTTIMADIVKMERVTKKSWLAGVPQVSEMLGLLWMALRRTGQIDDRDREGWGLRVADWGRIDTDDDGDDDTGGGLGPTP